MPVRTDGVLRSACLLGGVPFRFKTMAGTVNGSIAGQATEAARLSQLFRVFQLIFDLPDIF